MSKTTWRLIEDGPASGAWNMAVDEALLLHGEAGAVLRFYSWQPACVSIGRFQDRTGIAPGIDLVRRPSGGRAVWHEHEVTYSAVVPESLLPRDQRSVLGAYQWLSRGFLRGLASLGVEAEQAARNDVAPAGRVNCFAGPSRCDFVVGGQKLLGAAQCRKDGVVLQHGSLLLRIDEAKWLEAVGTVSNMTSLAAVCGSTNQGEVIRALKIGLTDTLEINLAVDGLRQAEEVTARHLHCSKYGTVEWNMSGRG